MFVSLQLIAEGHCRELKPSFGASHELYFKTFVDATSKVSS